MSPAEPPAPSPPLVPVRAGRPSDLSPPFAREEFEALARALSRRLREGSLPPDDAYWWARMLCSEAHARELRLDRAA